MKFSSDAARARAMQLQHSGTYVEGRYFGERVDLAARFARALAMEYVRDVQVVERFTVDPLRLRRPGARKGYAVVLATATASGDVYT